jgi:hypothetical protein
VAVGRRNWWRDERGSENLDANGKRRAVEPSFSCKERHLLFSGILKPIPSFVSPFGRSIQQVIFPSEPSKRLYGRNGNMLGDTNTEPDRRGVNHSYQRIKDTTIVQEIFPGDTPHKRD